MNTSKANCCSVSDSLAEEILQMAKCYYSDPQNARKYEAWYLKEYGCLPKENSIHK